jgi:3-deoxy-D-manno-octulosonate 8-phosphate phosphatase (KDO 8-P phosphatase)
MFEEHAEKIKLLILDVDGVMTDGRIIVNDQGEELKFFDAKDGQGLKLLMNAGIEVGIISGRHSGAVDRRAESLGIREVHLGIEDKASVLKALIEQRGLKKEEVCCMGDDLPDLALFSQAGFPVAVADAVPEVLDAALFITEKGGGKGAVREVCELILKAEKLWPEMLLGFNGHEKIDFTGQP